MPDRETTVLLAEDDDFFMKPLTYALVDAGYLVVAAETIESVRKHAREADVLVVDARMSDTQLLGVSTVAQLIEEGVVSSAVPVVFISVLAENDDACQQEIRNLSVLQDRYVWLQKYFETDRLLTAIDEELRARST